MGTKLRLWNGKISGTYSLCALKPRASATFAHTPDMLSVNQLTVSFGGRTLFDGISFLVQPKDRIGLVGKNGAGKSTLLKRLAAAGTAPDASLSIRRELQIGYLPQDMEHQDGRTVLDEALTAFEQARAMEEELAALEKELTERTDYETQDYLDLAEALSELHERINMMGGQNLQAEAERVLAGLGFTRNDLYAPTSTFSGGWRMRVELAKILLRQPDLILLDEPTNHLDIESIQWLEQFLVRFTGGVVLVSHDRDFLDRVTNRTIEIAAGKAFDYRMPYSAFMVQRAERIRLQEQEAKNQEKVIEHTEALINKYRAKANKAAFAQSLIKKLDRMERVEVDEMETAGIQFRFPPAPHSGKVVVLAKDVSVSYGEKHVLQNVELEVVRGQKVAFVGKNGQGKSTMIKALVGELVPSGSIEQGHQVNIGYYAQNQAETLDPNKTVFETIDDVAKGEVRKQVRALLGSFLFGGDEIEKRVSVLSGGERARLALCKLLLEPYNLLVLDEPTNHLDMRSKEMLKMALQKYNGTLIVVSHDRNFLHELTTHIFEFRGGSAVPYIGDIYDFLRDRKGALDEGLTSSSGPKGTENTTRTASTKTQLTAQHSARATDIQDAGSNTSASAVGGNLKGMLPEAAPNDLAARKEWEKLRKKRAQLVEKAEAEVAHCESELARLEAEMSSGDFAGRTDQDQVFSRYTKAKEALASAMNLWELAQAEFDAMGAP